MKSKLTRIILPIIAAIFWIFIWQAVAVGIDLDFVFPRFENTLKAFLSLVITSDFWITVAHSIGRIILGFAIGAILGILIAPLTHHVKLLHYIISPAMTVIKATPVASFILVLWCIIGKALVPTAIGILMVMPIVWQNLSDGFNAVSKNLEEVCTVFEVSYVKKLKVLVLPTLVRYLTPALVTASALAWKSGIAAEIIVYAKNSIGREITDAKNFFESEIMFAWTIAVIILSIAIELLIKTVTKAIKKI